MKTKLVTPIQDAFYLRKRAIIETIFDQLKNIFQVEHSRNPNKKSIETFSGPAAFRTYDRKQISNTLDDFYEDSIHKKRNGEDGGIHETF